MKTVTIYTDGACNPNPGPGGWAAVLIFGKKKVVRLKGCEVQSTNNRMELTAAIQALQHLKEPHAIVIYTDSSYLKKGISEWLPQWKRRNWHTSEKSAVKNQELWQDLDDEINRHKVEWHWTRGHAGNQWNEQADALARSMIARAALPVSEKEVVHIFLGASYLGKEKSGGWAILLRYNESVKTLSGGDSDTSGNRMHILSAINGLKALKKAVPVHIYTSSSYLKDGATRWVDSWRAKNWLTLEGKPVSNRDLWEQLAVLRQKYRIKWFVVNKEEMPPEMQQAKELAVGAALARV